MKSKLLFTPILFLCFLSCEPFEMRLDHELLNSEVKFSETTFVRNSISSVTLSTTLTSDSEFSPDQITDVGFIITDDSGNEKKIKGNIDNDFKITASYKDLKVENSYQYYPYIIIGNYNLEGEESTISEVELEILDIKYERINLDSISFSARINSSDSINVSDISEAGFIILDEADQELNLEGVVGDDLTITSTYEDLKIDESYRFYPYAVIGDLTIQGQEANISDINYTFGQLNSFRESATTATLGSSFQFTEIDASIENYFESITEAGFILTDNNGIETEVIGSIGEDLLINGEYNGLDINLTYNYSPYLKIGDETLFSSSQSDINQAIIFGENDRNFQLRQGARNNKIQFIITAEELTTIGFPSEELTLDRIYLRFDDLVNDVTLNNVSLKIEQVDYSVLPESFVDLSDSRTLNLNDFETIFQSNSGDFENITIPGSRTLNNSQNLIIELSYTVNTDNISMTSNEDNENKSLFASSDSDISDAQGEPVNIRPQIKFRFK